MSSEDIRWEQRFNNFQKALRKLNQAVEQIRSIYEDKNARVDDNVFTFDFDIVKEGLIQRFEYTHELAWKVMKDYAFYQGNSEIGGSRDATREAYQQNLITDGKVWMEMIGSRNKTSHTYNEATADEIFNKIMNEYHPAFIAFDKVMEGKRSDKNSFLESE